MFKITYFTGNQLNVKNGQIVEYKDLAEMFEQFRRPKKGCKHNGYFVRGECLGNRCDDNIHAAKIIVIDGDSSKTDGNAPDPASVHIRLIDLGYNHFIYTTHSHSAKKNKFRCVLACSQEIEKKDLKATVKQIMDELDMDIKHVKEMNVWSQPWFIPTRDDPEDGLFFSAGWFEGKDVMPTEESEEFSASDGSDSKGWRERMEEITKGVNFHENIRNISWALSNEGVSATAIATMLKMAMELCNDKNERWKQRYDDIERLVLGALDKQDQEKRVNLDDIVISDGPVLRDIPWPPGMMGELVEDAYMMERFRYREVALVSALGLLAGICGRKFNVSNTGLNLYLTLIMGTGMGKEQIRDFINGTLMSLGDKGQVTSSFIGPGKFNSFKSAIFTLKEARSQVCVFTEAGIMFKSAGDQASVTKALLHLYTCSGYNQYTIGESFSDSDKNVPVIRSPSMSIISESTPESLLSVFMEQGAGQQGDLPRQSIFRLVGDKPYAEPFPQTEIREHLKKKLQILVKKCAEIQATDDYQVYNMLAADQAVQSDMIAFSHHCVDMENQYREINAMKSFMYSRLFVKALKFAALASIMNYDDYPFIPAREWNWAKDLANYEVEGLDALFANSSSFDPLIDIARNVVGRQIVKLLSGSSKDPKAQPTKKERDTGMIKKPMLAYCLKNNARLKEYDTFNKFAPSATTGLDKVIKWMVNSGYLVEVKGNSAIYHKEIEYVKVTSNFPLLMA